MPKPGAALAGAAGQRRQRRVREDQPGAKSAAAPAVARATERADHAQRETGGDGASVPHDVFDDAVNAAMDAQAALGDLQAAFETGEAAIGGVGAGSQGGPCCGKAATRCRQCTVADNAPLRTMHRLPAALTNLLPTMHRCRAALRAAMAASAPACGGLAPHGDTRRGAGWRARYTRGHPEGLRAQHGGPPDAGDERGRQPPLALNSAVHNPAVSSPQDRTRDARMRPPLRETPSASRAGSVGHVAGPPTTVATPAGELPPAAAGVEAGEPFLHVRFLQRESAGSPPASRAAPGSVWAWHSHIFNWGARARAVVAN